MIKITNLKINKIYFKKKIKIIYLNQITLISNKIKKIKIVQSVKNVIYLKHQLSIKIGKIKILTFKIFNKKTNHVFKINNK
jgi:hypothetical protein